VSYVSTVLSDSPTGFWLLNEASGNFVDQTANGFTLTANGSITYGAATGFAGTPKGITLNGNTANFASVANNALLSVNGNFTIEALVLPANTTTLMMAAGKAGDATIAGFELGISAAGKGLLRQTSNGTAMVTGATTLSTVTWQLIAATFNNQVAGTATVYLNGVSDGSNVPGVTVSGNSTAAFVVGQNLNGGTASLPWNGGISAVAFYQTQLSASRLLAHFNALQSASGGGAVLVRPGPSLSVVGLIARQQTRKPPHPTHPPTPTPAPTPTPTRRPRFVPGERRKTGD
jgi:hypothetical protein